MAWAGASTGYVAVYCFEILLLCATVVVTLPLVRGTSAGSGGGDVAPTDSTSDVRVEGSSA